MLKVGLVNAEISTRHKTLVRPACLRRALPARALPASQLTLCPALRLLRRPARRSAPWTTFSSSRWTTSSGTKACRYGRARTNVHRTAPLMPPSGSPFPQRSRRLVERAKAAYDAEQARVARCPNEDERKWVRAPLPAHMYPHASLNTAATGGWLPRCSSKRTRTAPRPATTWSCATTCCA